MLSVRRSLITWLVALVGCRPDVTSPNRAGPLQIEWQRTLGGEDEYWLGRPALDGGRLFVQYGNRALGLDAATGRILWSRPVRHASVPARTVLLAREGRVYVSEVDSVLALDAATGRTVWNFRPDSAAVVVPALDETTLYTGQRGIPTVYAIALASGQLRWRTNLGVGYQYLAHVQGVAVSGDTVYATVTRYLNEPGGFASGVLVALDRRDGRELWRWETSGTRHRLFLGPVVAGRYVLVNDLEGFALHAIDPATRAEAWQADFVGNGASRVFVVGGTAYVAGYSGFTLAIDVASGAVKWRQTGHSGAFGGAYCAGSFYVSETRLLRFDGATGKELGRIDAGAGVVSVFTSDVATNDTSLFVVGMCGASRVSCR